jgi:hypothetical protein
MRGGAQAHLVEASDGNFYVVKFINNPQHRRVLVNEWVATTLLDYLQLNSARAAVVDFTPDFLAANPDITIQHATRTLPVLPGWHFGSRYPGNPIKVAVYDFLPDLLLAKVANRGDYAGALVFDQWMANADARQTVFYRASVADAQHSRPPRNAFVALLVDHGYVFGGPDWVFRDSPLRGLYHRPQVYANIRGWADFEPWLERIRHFPEEIIDRALRSLPPQWLGENGEDRDDLEALLERLMRRRARVADLIEDVRDSQAHPFPEWKKN